VSCCKSGGSPTAVYLAFLDRSRYFSFKQLLNCTHEAEWTPLIEEINKPKMSIISVNVNCKKLIQARKENDIIDLENCEHFRFKLLLKTESRLIKLLKLIAAKLQILHSSSAIPYEDNFIF
jgi:hypothetical protein